MKFTTTTTRRILGGLVALAITGGLTAGTAAASQRTGATHRAAAASTPPVGGSPVLAVTAVDDSYQMPSMSPLKAGLVTIRLRNAGTQPHQATIVRFHDGVTFAQFATAFAHGGSGAAMALVDFEGGVNTVDPGTTAVAYSKLTAGNYALLCFVQGPDGLPHAAKGMVMPFQVVGPAHSVRTPQTKGTVGLSSYKIHLPAGFGHGLYAVTNSADEPHELAIVKVAAGKTPNDVMNFLMETTPSGPPPFSGVGGVAALSPGLTSYGAADLKPGHYVALCFVPDDQAPHLPHFMMGMFQPFTVS